MSITHYETVRVHAYIKDCLDHDITELVRKHLKLHEDIPVSKSIVLKIVFEEVTGKKFENGKLV